MPRLKASRSAFARWAKCKKDYGSGTCAVCGTLILFHSKRQQKKKFCSPKCRLIGRPADNKALMVARVREFYNTNPLAALRGSAHPRWKGGRQTTQKYIRVIVEHHPKAWRDGRMFEHIWVAEQCLGRLLEKGEVVHHKNGKYHDNNPDNLAVMSLSEHTRMHQLGLFFPSYDGQFPTWIDLDGMKPIHDPRPPRRRNVLCPHKVARSTKSIVP